MSKGPFTYGFRITLSPTFFPLRKKGVAIQKNSSGGMNTLSVVWEREEFGFLPFPMNSLGILCSILHHHTRGAALIPRFKQNACTHTISSYWHITAILISIAHRAEPLGVPRSPRRKKRSNNCVDAGLRMISQYRSIDRLKGHMHLSRCMYTGPSMQRGNASWKRSTR